MMLTISGLPSSTKYADLKGLIRQECGISEFILDKLSPDSNGMKKVQVGVMDDGQGNCLIKCLDGYRILGHVLSVTPLGQMQQESQHAPNNNFDRGNGNYTQKNYQGNQSQQGNYDSLDTHRPEPWNSGGHGNQWEPQSHQNMNAHNNMGYQQQVPMNNYGQQQGQQSHQGHQPSREMHYQNDYPPPASQPNTHHSGYVGGYNAQNNVNKAVPPAKASQRPHVLRSVEILQEPARYDHPHTHVGSIQQQKPITIMKENFQGAQFGAHYQQPGPSWQPPVQQEKPAFKPASYDRSFTEPNNIELAPHDNYNAPMPRFSPRDEVPKNLGPKFSPRRDIPKPGPRFSPRRDINKDASRFSPRRDVPKDGPRFSPRRELGKSGPGPRFSPRRDVPRFSPRRDVPKDGPGPRFSPRRDIPKDGPRFSPRRDVPKPGPRFSPRRDISKSGPGPRFSPGRDIIKPGPGPRFSPRRDIGNDGPRFSPRRDIPKEGPRFSPRRDLKDRVGPRFSPHRDIPRFSPRRDLPKDVPRFSPRRDIPKDAPRFSPRRELHKEGPRFSPRRDLAKDGPRFSPRMDIPKDHVPRFSPRRDAPRFSPRRDVSKAGPGPRFSPRRDISGPIRVSPGRRMSPGRRISPGDRRAGPRRSPHRDSPPRTGRYSPTRHMDKPPEKYVAKDVRPAYEPNSAPSQAMYTDVYRAIVTDNVQYPIPALRQPEVPVWQQIRDKSGERRSKFEANIPTGVEDKRLPERKSRSPLRSDRFKRHSPSPRSPRRSWALEKRRSPDIRDAPPPPIWPGASNDDYRPKEKTPTWERPAFDDKLRRPEERNNPNRVRPDLKGPLDPPTRRFEDRFPREQSPVRQDMGRKNYHERKFEKDIPERREERFPTAKPLTKVQEQFEKEIEDVYKRAVEFTKRTEVLRKGDRRREEHSDGRRETERVYERPYSREESRREDDFRDDRRHEDSYKRNEERSQDFGRHETKYLEKKRSDPQEYRGKKEKAEDDLADKLMKKYGDYLSIDMKRRVLVELKIAISKMLRDMFGNDDVSYIEMIIKFTAKYEKDEKKIFNDVLSNFPSNYRKRPAEETLKTDHPSAKVPKRTPETNVNQGALPVPVIPAVEQQTSIADWSMANMTIQQSLLPMLQMPMSHVGLEVPMMMQPVMCPPPAYDNLNTLGRSVEQTSVQPEPETYNLFLCKDDFEPYSITQAEFLKKFLISQLVQESQSGQGWAPDFMIKGLQSQVRYELCTRDLRTKQWIENLSFDQFKLYNVLVYSKEELWYERAAIWLPGHSKYRSIDALQKLKLQNKKLSNVNLGKWKFVKQIVTAKGTRLYVDMPPSSARALEKHKMQLSYELQKVSVFLKAVAIDKDVFDQGLREMSLKDEAEIVEAIKNSAMPSLGSDPYLVKIALKGNKTVTLFQARKIKEILIFHIYRYHLNGGSSKTDFTKYGFCNPGYFGVVAQNDETKKWLMSLDLGKLKKHVIEVVGANELNVKYVPMQVEIRQSSYGGELPSGTSIIERIQQSNKGTKGLKCHLWKYKDRKALASKGHGMFNVDIDLESVETLIKMGFQVDFFKGRSNMPVFIRYADGKHKLMKLIETIKNESHDTYDDSEMDIASSDDDDEVIFMGQVNN